MTTIVPYNAGFDWGVIPDAASLPNASGSSIQSPNVRVGSRAYVPGLGVYVCSDATAGAATWDLGSTFAEPATLIYSESDFPAAVANVITLDAGTVYEIKAVVTLTAGNRIEIPATSALVGVTAGVSQIVGDVDNDLITTIGTAGTVRYDSVRIQNNSLGSASCAVNQAVSGSTLLLLTTTLVGGEQAYRCTASVSVAAWLSSFTCINTNGSAIDIDTGGSFNLTQCSTICVGASADHIRMRSGATITTFSVQSHAFTALAAAQVGIDNEGVTAMTRIQLRSIIIQGAGAGSFTINIGWTQATPGWSVSAVDTISDSTAIGQALLGSSVTVVVTSSLTYYDVANNPATVAYTLDSDSERFALEASTGDENGELEFTGVANRTGLITGSIACRRAAGSAVIGVRVAVYIDGILHPSSVASTDVTNRLTQISISPSIHTFTTGQLIRLVVMNEDDTTDLIVERAVLAIACSIVT